MTPRPLLQQHHTSFRKSLFLIFTISTGIISAVFLFILINAEIRNYQERSTERAQLLASLLASTITLNLYSENTPELEHKAEELLATPRVARILIKNYDGRILVNRASPAIGDHAPLTTASASVVASTTSPSAETALSGVAAAQAPPYGWVSVSVDDSDRNASIRQAIVKACGLALLFWLGVVAASYPILKRITQSFLRLTEGLTSMMGGDFSAEIVIDSDDEAGRAAQAVNRLAATLKEREIENLRLQEELVNAMRMEVQEERRQIMAKLIQTNRMTSLGLLISSIAHNINTPNGAIKLAAQHLVSSWRDTIPILEHVAAEEGDYYLGGLPYCVAKVEIGQAIDSILNNAHRVERVIQDLRTYNLGGRSELHPTFSINRMVDEAITIIRAHGRQGEITITPTLSPNIPDIRGNQYQLEQVVVNLLLNAMQAMSNNKGVVTVATEYSSDSGQIRIIITDRGDGISPEDQKQLFNPFFTTRIDKGGSGLGLYISKYIVTEHNGYLTVESEYGVGTVATVYIPVKRG